ncbi:MAG TPA: carboxypeptidase-like regulatory domain-containing protein [Pirellulales bacterium]|nr:carboxypeptidase-like regulatory domain-containing protein [Pirellulales bacterium]
MFHRFGICALLALLVAGCSGGGRDAGTVAVTGKVTYGGQAVEGATVTFASTAQSGAPGAAITGADGAYTLRAKPGNYAVMVSKLSVAANTQQVSMEQAVTDAAKAVEEPKNLLPAKYSNPVESPLKAEVKASGTNTFDLALSD